MSYVKWSENVEKVEADEEKVFAELTEALLSISEKTLADTGHGLRSVHAKSHGMLDGTLVVHETLPAVLKQGLFREAGSYPVQMRLSSTPGDELPDVVSTPRGLSIKILDVPGERLPGSESERVQDFVLVNGPAFAAPDPEAFLKKIKLLAATTDRFESFKKVISQIFHGTEKALEAVGLESANLKAMGGHPRTHPLGETYFSQAPIRFGEYVAKVSLAPKSESLRTLKDQAIDVSDELALRHAVERHFAADGGVWELRVQLCTDLESMPVEDASVPWSEEKSPFLTVGEISVAPQAAWTEERAKIFDDCLLFSPWQGVAEHRPLGSIMRARKQAYRRSADFRQRANGCPMHRG